MATENSCICPNPLGGRHVANCMIHGWSRPAAATNSNADLADDVAADVAGHLADALDRLRAIVNAVDGDDATAAEIRGTHLEREINGARDVMFAHANRTTTTGGGRKARR